MNIMEAAKLVAAGKRVRRREWLSRECMRGVTLGVCEFDGLVKDQEGRYKLYVRVPDVLASDWEEA